MSEEPVIRFSNKQSLGNLKAKIGQNLLTLTELTKSAVKSSESNELFKNCFKNFAASESVIEASCDKYNKINIIAGQLNFQVESIRKDCESLDEVCKQIDSLQKKSDHYHLTKSQ